MSRSTLNIFISYGRRDGRELALRLRNDLQRLGHSVWLDTNEIPGGANWAQQIEQAIEHCDVTLALISHASYESQWCRAEQLRSLRKGKRIIPLRLQGDAEVPLTLEHLNHLDFTELGRYEALFRDLVSDMLSGTAFNPRETATTSVSPYKPVDNNESRADDEKR
ncbi:MAG: toll/interleukin-1 receptor domain-containing protein, partial [Anaerolineae bacterium]|nr:toll/interleukin-1 receptor domain-containing protein [Anaerolineae bacterium]